MPIAFPLGSSSIPAAPAAAPTTPMNSVQNNRIWRAVWYLDFVCIYISPIHHKVPQPGCGLPYYCGTRCGGQARRSTVPPARSRLFSAIRAENESGSGCLRSCSVNLAEYAVKMA